MEIIEILSVKVQVFGNKKVYNLTVTDNYILPINLVGLEFVLLKLVESSKECRR